MVKSNKNELSIRCGISNSNNSIPQQTVSTAHSSHLATSPSARYRRHKPPGLINVKGQTLIPPNTSLARSIVMGNESSRPSVVERTKQQESQPRTSDFHFSPQHQGDKPVASNLTMLMEQQQRNESVQSSYGNFQMGSKSFDSNSINNEDSRGRLSSNSSGSCHQNEADTASGPPPPMALGRSAPGMLIRPARVEPLLHQSPPSYSSPDGPIVGISNHSRRKSVGAMIWDKNGDRVRRCMSSKELKTLAPPSGSPYAFMLQQMSELENSMRDRLTILRESEPDSKSLSLHCQHTFHSDADGSSTTSSRARREPTNEMRNKRRAQHAKAVIDDLCSVVTDLFLAESKLLNPTNYGVQDRCDTSRTSDLRDIVVRNVHAFVSSLPSRYALGADTPSVVLLHMRLMAAARSDRTKAAVHIHNLEDDDHWSITVAAASAKKNHLLRLVTISCCDKDGLLEYITKMLATGGSRVLDADVMLSTDGIALDRFVVEMTGRLRLDKLSNLVEDFLNVESCAKSRTSPMETTGPLYYIADQTHSRSHTPEMVQRKDIEKGIPLSEVLASSSQGNFMYPAVPNIRALRSRESCSVSRTDTAIPVRQISMLKDDNLESSLTSDEDAKAFHSNLSPPPLPLPPPSITGTSLREQRPLVNRQATSDLDAIGPTGDKIDDGDSLDYLTVPGFTGALGAGIESRHIPLIPFDELMLIETVGTGRVSTIYRAAWQRMHNRAGTSVPGSVQMVALKVAMVNTMTGDTSHVDELRREADIAARLEHPNICDLIGIAADPECFCLAYDFCEGGSLLSLLSDSRRYYEYLPIAMDIANGMAYLHSRSVIHRDLKPSNILLTRDHRAKIADFGMSVRNAGQELTAETGTYRYMAPEVIRHESYSSNADVYSFGLCLWQLITRQIPFATMTPIQAAYSVAEGIRPEIPDSTPRRLREIITACWDHQSHKRPSFTYIAMALADYAKMAFSPANVGALTLQIANEVLANIEGNSTVNVDITTQLSSASPFSPSSPHYVDMSFPQNDSNVGLEIE